MTNKPKCKCCGEDMTLVNLPCEIFTIPFTKGRFSIWDMGHKEYQCMICATEASDIKQQRLIDDISDSMGQKEYEEGYEAGSSYAG
uniref:Uncharacterized protein n=1 Tax=viral metagenome TaxID=1070528 RepID=A0A6M3KR26_9ZZZZ